ncbi:hypothetical protein [Hymenobacter terricola]|nr:hypothetical protein [Hymenobacter terricola]
MPSAAEPSRALRQIRQFGALLNQYHRTHLNAPCRRVLNTFVL